MNLKKEKKLSFVCKIVTIIIVSITLCSCPGPTPDPTPPSLSLSLSEITFSSKSGDAQQLTITTDADATWQIVYVPNWLRASSKEGKGSAPITLTTKSDNDTDLALSDQIEIKAVNEDGLETTEKISVQQSPSDDIESDCFAQISKVGEDLNLLTMSYGMACVMEWGNNTRYFKYHLYKDTEFSSMSGDDNRIIQEATISGSNWQQKDIPSSGGVEILFENCQPNTRYILVTIGFSAKGKRGRISQEPFTTKSGSEDQPIATILPEKMVVNEVQGGNNGAYYKWDIKQSRTSNGYYTYVCASENLTETMRSCESRFGVYDPKNGVNIAWEISMKLREGWLESKEVSFNKKNTECREKLFTKSLKDDVFAFASKSTDRYLQIVTWAVGEGDKPSGLVYDIVYQIENGHLIPDPNPNELYVKPSPDNIEISWKGGDEETKPVRISSNTSWEATSSDSWCKINGGSIVSGTNEGMFNITAEENKTYNNRQATITIMGGKDIKTILVTQLGYVDSSVIGLDEYNDDKNLDGDETTTYKISVDQTTFSISAAGGTKSVKVTSNDAWTVSSNQSWCTISPSSGSNNGTITIKAESNSSSSRTATVTIKGTNSGKSVTVSVFQEAGTIIGRDEYGNDKEIK